MFNGMRLFTLYLLMPILIFEIITVALDCRNICLAANFTINNHLSVQSVSTILKLVFSNSMLRYRLVYPSPIKPINWWFDYDFKISVLWKKLIMKKFPGQTIAITIIKGHVEELTILLIYYVMIAYQLNSFLLFGHYILSIL